MVFSGAGLGSSATAGAHNTERACRITAPKPRTRDTIGPSSVPRCQTALRTSVAQLAGYLANGREAISNGNGWQATWNDMERHCPPSGASRLATRRRPKGSFEEALTFALALPKAQLPGKCTDA